MSAFRGEAEKHLLAGHLPPLTHLGHRCHTQAQLVADESDSQSLRKSCFAETVGELGEVLLSAK
jgi:hypothetical protein